VNKFKTKFQTCRQKKR